MTKFFSLKNWDATQRLTFSFFIVIILGSILLSLPISVRQGVHLPYLDHLFTAVSMVCVTGLTVLSVQETYTWFGQLISMILIQVGGLGLVTLISMSLYFLKRKLSLKDQSTLLMALNRNSSDNYLHFLQTAYRYTFWVELISACILMTDFIPRYGLGAGIFNAFFISISAFCNAGFDNLGSSSLQGFILNPTVNFTVAFLIIFGGIGFSVVFELKDRFVKFIHARPRIWHLNFRHLSSHTRLVLLSTVLLLIIGTVIPWLSELHHQQTIGDYSFSEQFMISFFQSTAFRTAGFATIDYSQTHPFTNLIYMVLMVIGGAPGGTAGGIKVTTAAIMFLLFRSELKGHDKVTFRNRVIPSQLVKQAMTIILFFFTMVIIGYSLLLLTHPHLNAFDLLFETISALATVGSTMGVTPLLATPGKLIIIGLMFIGRVGPFTVFLSIIQRGRKEIYYAETELLIG